MTVSTLKAAEVEKPEHPEAAWTFNISHTYLGVRGETKLRTRFPCFRISFKTPKASRSRMDFRSQYASPGSQRRNAESHKVPLIPFFYKKPTFLFVSVKRLKLLEKRFCSRYNAERFKNILKARKTIDYC